MKIALNYVSVSIAGDYYQVSFDAKEEDGTDEITDDPYFSAIPARHPENYFLSYAEKI